MNASSIAARYRYSVFGLEVDSELCLPELFEGKRSKTADVTITVGAPPVSAQSASGFHAFEDGSLLIVETGGRYWVSGGREIVVEPEAGASERNVRLFLLGSAFGILLHQRGLLPLHANGVEIEGSIVAFIGRSGAGKSTLAAWFADSGFPLIADDVVVVDFQNGVPLVQPGLPRLRLWKAVVEATGRNPDQYAHSVEGHPTYDKRDILLEQSKLSKQPRPLCVIVELKHSGPEFEALIGVDAVDAVMSHTYRGGFLEGSQSLTNHWELCTRLVLTVPVFQACVNFDLDRLDDTYGPLVEHVRSALWDRR